MSEIIHGLIERYGLLAIFAGTVLEGETAVILGGFFAHQGLFSEWAAYVAAALGAFVSDCLFFLLGRRFASHPIVAQLRTKPGFSHANEMVRAHPNIFVFGNRFVYGMRLVGGVAAGLSEISAVRFVIINALAAVIWTAAFFALGYFFGLGAQAVLGKAVHQHERLLIGLGLGLLSLAAAWLLTRHFSRKQARRPDTVA